MPGPQDQRSPLTRSDWSGLAARLAGSLHTDDVTRRLYATDASEYRELPMAVALPRSEADIRELILFAGAHGVGVIPRTAGTSLAGQVVGGGIVVDVSRHFGTILAIDAVGRRARVQPGVIRNELNLALRPHGLLFGPETSTASRAMMGGMVGNNSSGSNSLVYGSTREHLVSVRGFLSDGSEVTFGPLSAGAFAAKCAGPDDAQETRIYRTLRVLLADPEHRRAIEENFPKKTVTRRNTGYALDLLMDAAPLDPHAARDFNACRLLAGSEGTLFFAVELELDLDPLPPPEVALLCGHFDTVNEALLANLVALRHRPSASELIDRHILECTRLNLEQSRNRTFVQGDPGALLAVELRRDTRAELERDVARVEAELRAAGLGHAYPILYGTDTDQVWALRRAGQGLMSNVPGDAKPREVVEDTAVDVQDLPAYIAEFDTLMRKKYRISCVYYAHAGAGEIHTRPLFDLKTEAGRKMFRAVAEDVAALVKKYRGSLSGEHGDGRLRGEFIRFMVGDVCYDLMREVKRVFDPHGLFNPGKIIDTPPMDTSFRHAPGEPTPDYETFFRFPDGPGVVRAAEKCNGVGECRKTHLSGGTMCPSYMATRNERATTRARANLLRETLNHPPDPAHPFAGEELHEILDLCLSCKACKAECPSSVDMTRLKAEALQHHHDDHHVPLRTRLVGSYARLQQLAVTVPWLWNAVTGTPALRRLINRLVGFHPDRTLPGVCRVSLRKWFAARSPRPVEPVRGRVFLFCDEFTDVQDVPVGMAAVKLLEGLGYEVLLPDHAESGRACLSKGLLRQARRSAETNVRLLSELVTADMPLIGIEPSAILGFRDEYPDLVEPGLAERARALAANTWTIDEFVAREMERGAITPASFTDERLTIHLHAHCHQKALSSQLPTLKMLGLPRHFVVRPIPSGCCGMAGSFGYEREHYELSMQIGELVLFPTVRALGPDEVVAATGTSCRHQIHDGTGRVALHPVQILHQALRVG